MTPTRELSRAMYGAVDDMLRTVLVDNDIATASRMLAAMDRETMGMFLGALAYRAVKESGIRPGGWVLDDDDTGTGTGTDDPDLIPIQMIVAAGNHDNDLLVELANRLMDRKLIAVGWAVRVMIIAVREAREMRAGEAV